MATTFYIVSHLHGNELQEPLVFATRCEAERAAKDIMDPIIRDAYESATGVNASDMTFETLLEWAREVREGGSLYWLDWGGNDSAEVLVTKATV